MIGYDLQHAKMSTYFKKREKWFNMVRRTDNESHAVVVDECPVARVAWL